MSYGTSTTDLKPVPATTPAVLPAEGAALLLPVATSKLPIEVELAASFIQHQCEPTEMVAFTCPLDITTPYETFRLQGPLLVLSFAHSPVVTLPRPLSADKTEVEA